MIEAVLKDGKVPDAEKRSCYDCRHCKAAVSWWCQNKAAIEYRGTKIPGIINCNFWEPCRVELDLSKKEKRSLNVVLI